MPGNIDFTRAFGEIAVLVFSGRAKNLIKKLSMSESQKSRCLEFGDKLKLLKSSMKVEERDYLYQTSSVTIGNYLYHTNSSMKSFFASNAKISKSGMDNSDLLQIYEIRMKARLE